jgi:hypothetical protein
MMFSPSLYSAIFGGVGKGQPADFKPTSDGRDEGTPPEKISPEAVKLTVTALRKGR